MPDPLFILILIPTGFRESVAKHGLIYNRLVGDGDSSVMNKLSVIRPYGDIMVEKVECINHAMVRLRGRLEDMGANTKAYSLSDRQVLKKLISQITHVSSFF